MYQRILVPLDGSARAEEALPIAARLARASGGAVVLLRVAEAPVLPVVATLPATAPTTPADALALPLIEAEHQAATAYLARMAQADILTGVAVETSVEASPVAATILDAAQARAADLIVLCRQGHTGLARWAPGSVAEKVARHATVPVLVLQAGQQGSTVESGSTHLAVGGGPIRALVPLDGSLRAEHAVLPAAQIVAALSQPDVGEVRLLHVITPPLVARNALPQAGITTTKMAVLDEAQAYLSAVATRLQTAVATLALVSISASVRLADDIASAITESVEVGSTEDSSLEDNGVSATRPADVIAMATHGRGGLARWALGSITERVLQETQVPLLIVHPHDSTSGHVS
jgi:nucleotide-binding universal stress UspA family protein